MKWMKWFLVLLVGAGVAFCTAGCEDDEDEGGGNSLVGTWRATSYNGQALDAGTSVVVTFRSDGTATTTYNVAGVAEAVQGTWSEANGTLIVTSEGETDSAAYSISGDTLTIADEEGTFTLVRQ